ncbi:DUF3108 domain-containing protein [Rhodoferax saidenbachensis]|uniref:DUF3108 domain-containing protein n=1 Tax=Rhodoferax saidenbachensis TaxID=1484693 RepID=A0ABU1ZP86_9BURK|nr:DUF3108 domain-containing protein [Rhodoferax saidenbachensis]MDR7306761.1 hypothetical protein [Rhodoferax saidenbachensis]
MPATQLRRLCAAALLACTLAVLPSMSAAQSVSVPPAVRLNYDFEGVISSPYTGSAELLWQREGNHYTSQLVVRKFGLSLQTWTSKGTLTAQGLEPLRFGSKRLGKDEISANFLRPQGKITFSANTPDATLEAGAQDQLSVFMQLASVVAGEPGQWTAGKTVTFQAVGDRYAENWTFRAGALEPIKVPGGTFPAIKLTHEPTAERSQKLELWYVPSVGYLPLRIRITESNGDFLDLLWASSQKP